MDPVTTNTMGVALGKIGGALALGLSAIGSGLGIGAAGLGAIGAWKKCYAQNRPVPLIQLIVFVSAPITQTFYGMIVMKVRLLEMAADPTMYPAAIAWGLFGGIAIGLSAWIQGRIGAAAADAFAETGQGFANYLMALGIIESVAIFVMVFILVFA
jgi:V/A-type H+/Na+-transporting ATPase subunit K